MTLRGYDPSEPRIPAGKGGGQWTDGAPVDDDPYGEKMELEAATRQEARELADQTAVDMYQSTRWLEINDRLRAGDPLPGDAYEGGLGRRPADDGTPAHSPASDVARLDALMTSEGGVPFKTDVYRGIHSDNVFPPGNLAGLTFSDHGFISTTANRDLAEGFAFPGEGQPGRILMQIRLPAHFPAVLSEGEVILPRDTTFRILSDRATKGAVRRLLTAEVVAP